MAFVPPRSVTYLSHSASYTPTGIKSVSDANAAARTGRNFSNSRLRRFDSPVVGSDGRWRGRTMKKAARARPAKTRNAPRNPNGPMRSAPMSGPPVKPASSMPRNRPRRSAARAVSMLAAMALIAGPLVPSDAPVIARAATNIHSVLPKANIADPMAARISAARTKRFGFPRSAYGARKSWTMSDVKKPDAAMSPRPALLKPYLSCKSLRAAKIMLFETGTAKPQMRSGPMPMVNLARPRSLVGDVIDYLPRQRRTSSLNAGQYCMPHSSNSCSAIMTHAASATGSIHKNVPMPPKCPNVDEEFRAPVQCGFF